MEKPCQFNRTKPTNNKRWREVFSSEKEAFTANILKISKPNGLQPDVVLVSSDDVDFPAYKSYLSAASSYFRAMFDGTFREASSDRVVLHSVTSGVMKIILDYFHLDRLEQEAFRRSVEPIIVDVYRAAHMIDMTGLVKLTCTLLAAGTTRANYKTVWAIYDACPTETLHDHLCSSFRRYYQHFLNGRFLTFDVSLFKFALREWGPFVNQQLLVRIMLAWIQHEPKRREDCLSELSKILRPERLAPGYMKYLATEEEILRRHSEVLQQFQTYETTADVVQFRTEAGYDVIAEAISVLFFDIAPDNTTTVLRFSFSGCREEKVLPFKILRCGYAYHESDFACVQYKSKIYFVGHVAGYRDLNFIEYDFDDNSFVPMDSSPIRAEFYFGAFVVGDKMYVNCLDSGNNFVQFYDFLAGRKWTYVLNTPVAEFNNRRACELCPYENSFLILQADGDKNAIKVTRVNDSSSFTIPCKFNRGLVVHYNGQLWGFSQTRWPYEKRKFVYDLDKKCLKSHSEGFKSKSLSPEIGFMRIPSLQRHPLIVECELHLEKRCLTLIDIERDTVVGRVEHPYFPTERLSMAMFTYCKDVTL